MNKQKNTNTRHFSKGNTSCRSKKPTRYASPKDKRPPASDGLGKPVPSNTMRLNKYVANSGVCSRRDADFAIAAGLVTVNGQVVTEMGYKVRLDAKVRYDGTRVKAEKKAYILLNKPKGFPTTPCNTKGPTAMDLIAKATSAEVTPMGRLGKHAKGLVFFTNDTAIAKKFTRTKNGVDRLFHIELDRHLRADDFKKIQAGVKVEGTLMLVEAISYVRGASKNEVGLKVKNMSNASIRSIFEHFKYKIVNLDCVAIGPLTKKDIPRGRWKHLTEQELNRLKML